MPRQPRSARPITVAVTGAAGSLGQRVLPRLLASPGIARVLSLDLSAPALSDPKLDALELDLTHPAASQALAAALAERKVQVVLHLAFFSSSLRDPAYAHELEAIGTSHLLAGCAAGGVKSVVMSSTTMVYGASQANPNFLAEDRPLPQRAQSRYVADKIEAERQVQHFRRSHAGLRSTVLRLAPVVGPNTENIFTRFLRRPLAPMVLGYDPLIQCLHEDDAAEAMLCAVLARQSGDFNVAGRGVLPLSQVIALAGSRPVKIPLPFGSAALKALGALGVAAVPPSMLDYLRFLWVADGSAAWRALGFKPRYSSREAVLAFAMGRRAAA